LATYAFFYLLQSWAATPFSRGRHAIRHAAAMPHIATSPLRYAYRQLIADAAIAELRHCQLFCWDELSPPPMSRHADWAFAAIAASQAMPMPAYYWQPDCHIRPLLIHSAEILIRRTAFWPPAVFSSSWRRRFSGLRLFQMLYMILPITPRFLLSSGYAIFILLIVDSQIAYYAAFRLSAPLSEPAGTRQPIHTPPIPFSWLITPFIANIFCFFFTGFLRMSWYASRRRH